MLVFCFESRYITKKEKYLYKKENEENYRKLKKKIILLNKEKRLFIKEYKNIEKLVQKHNEKFIKKELEESKDIFNNVCGYTLDIEQQTAIVTEEDSNLIIAGAGSGKTLTMIGKIKYLIERKGIDPSKILCLSFTNTITNDFLKSLEKINYKIDVLTFHKLGVKILNLNKIPIQISDDNLLSKIIDKYFLKNFNNPKFKDNLKKYFGISESNIELRELKKLISTFINLFKSNNFNLEKWSKIEEKANNEINRLLRKRNIFLISIIKEIYLLYANILEENSEIDFNDMINEASNIIKEGYIYPQYDYIIVDEYQDTSYTRYNLLYTLKEKNNCHLLAVGDDWQSIYRFTGCDLEIFTNFDKYFKFTNISKIQTTYRNCQELIDVAGNFIMKNKKQFKKNLKSSKHIKKPIKMYLYKEKQEFSIFLDKILTEFNGNLFILGRNNNDLSFIENDLDFEYEDNILIYKKYPNIKIKYFTVHRSKGLECDKVILINLENNILGFPNQMSDDSIIRYISKGDYFPFEEERRLFYVALTRTKNEIYLFVPKKNKSIFVEEIIKDNPTKIEIIKK